MSRPPLFEIQDYNSFDAVLQDGPRTNNAVEGWHFAFNKRFPKARLPLSQFIMRLKDEEERTTDLAER